MMENLFVKAVHQNNAGASYLASNETKSALPVFKQALQCLQKVAVLSMELDEDRMVDNCMQLSSADAARRDHLDGLGCSPLKLEPFGCRQQDGGNNEETQSYYVYHQALLITYAPSGCNGVGHTESILAAATGMVMFNLALAFHQSGARVGGKAGSLNRALQLYQHCDQLQPEFTGTSGVFAGLQAAAMNNRAILAYTCLQDYEQAHALLEGVCDIIVHREWLEEVKTELSCNSILDRNDITEFFLNSLLLKKNPTMGAACA